MMLPVTAFFAGVLALWLMLLTWQVAKLRRTKRILLGDDGHGDAQRLIRGHGNAAETIPIFLILLGLGEGLGAPVWVVGALGVTFTAGRILHGLHFMWHRTDLSMRFSGMVLTLFSTTVAALGVMAHALAELF
jgi:uncharacterized membrane protein YecN with MAPEG domain